MPGSAGTEALQAMAEVMGCPVAVQFSAKSMFPETHPQYLGVYCGAISSHGVLDSLTSADVIIAVGTSYGCTCHAVPKCTTALLYSLTPTMAPFMFSRTHLCSRQQCPRQGLALTEQHAIARQIGFCDVLLRSAVGQAIRPSALRPTRH